MAIASDLEGTLTTGRTWRALAAYLSEHGRGRSYRTTYLRNVHRALLVRARVARVESFREHWLRQMLGLFAGMPEEAFEEVAEWVVDEVLWPRRRAEVVAAMRVHQAAGERVVLASGAFQPVVEAFARRLQRETGSLAPLALGTPLRVREGTLQGDFAAPLNIGEVKARRLHDALGTERLYAAYGDSGDDVPMLLLSDRPVAVYPDAVLRRTAGDLGWSVFEP